MSSNRSISFFENQFREQIAARDFALNPFEKAVLPFVRGRVLDLGCGLGNLSIEAARAGAEVIAIDASAAAIDRIQKVAKEEGLRIEARVGDAVAYEMRGQFDTIVAIGLLMFLQRETALGLLAKIQQHSRVAIINVLVGGTTYMDMFDPGAYCLFGADELERRFAGWKILLSKRENFDAPGNTKKAFSTVVAERIGL